MKRPVHPIIKELKEIRVSKNITLLQLGARAGYSSNHIWNVENGKINAKFSMIVDLAQALGVPVELKK